ncbi:unnamed protein product [Auanema sp. JU1783]|nr:unnamed protein product [Auanema sp. JU1783]
MQSRYFLLLTIFSLSSAYVFDCLDDCECDTDDEVIHCHNGHRTELSLPESRLRGFPVIGLTYNKLVNLPDEKVLLFKFPDLKVIDVERNPFNCSSTDKYRAVKIVSDCDKNVTEISKVPQIFRPSRDCDASCQLKRHYQKLHEYVLNLWEILKEKYDNFDYDRTLIQIKEFFLTVADKVNNFRNEVQQKIKDSQSDSGEIEVPQ